MILLNKDRSVCNEGPFPPLKHPSLICYEAMQKQLHAFGQAAPHGLEFKMKRLNMNQGEQSRDGSMVL